MSASQGVGASGKYCLSCGQIIPDRAQFCPACGVQQSVAGAQAPHSFEHSKLVAALLAVFLGGIGLHKFYLGRVGWGIVYLLFFWTFIPTIVGFIEGLIYLSMSEGAFHRKYG
jgi:TM2 domain-containing membrane protein YozV